MAAPLDPRLPQSLVSIHDHSELFLDGVGGWGRWGADDCAPARRAATTCSTNPDCKQGLSGVSDSLSSVMMEIYFQHVKTSRVTPSLGEDYLITFNIAEVSVHLLPLPSNAF